MRAFLSTGHYQDLGPGQSPQTTLVSPLPLPVHYSGTGKQEKLKPGLPGTLEEPVLTVTNNAIFSVLMIDDWKGEPSCSQPDQDQRVRIEI